MRFLHTADWQLGLKLRFLQPEKAAQMRMLRFQTVRNIAKLAHQARVEGVIVAGDVLDDNALGRDSLQQASDALKSFGEIPVGLLPGNHDALTPDSALLRLDLPDNVHILSTREPVSFGGAQLYPCPLFRRHERDDPTEWLPSRQTDDTVRIAVAHGGIINFSADQEAESPNLINADRVLSKGFDYLALGDWHGTFRYKSRAWYSGAPEPTRFKEVDPGAVLLVDIDAPGEEPRVERIPVAQTYWHTLPVDFVDGSQVAVVRSQLESLPELSQTLVFLQARGVLSMAFGDELDALIDEFADRLAYLRHDVSDLVIEPTESDLASLQAESFTALAYDRLRSGGTQTDMDAIRLMYQLQQRISRDTN